MRYALTILSVLLISVTVSWGFDLSDSLQDKAIIQMAVKKLLLQDEENRANEKKGLASRNNYVINIDTKNWIEEQGTSEKKILSSDDFSRMSQNLQVFNSRKDALRFYVIVINDYAVKFKTVIDPSLVGDTFKWNDLQKYTEQQKSIQEIWGKTKVLMDGISSALNDKGFSQRMVYFYGQLKVAEYDGKIHNYKFDRLNFYGDFIEPLGNEISKRAKSVAKDAVKNIDQAIINIINGAKAVIDGEDNAPSVDCSQSMETIVGNTKSVRDKEYEKQVADFATLIDQPTTAQQKVSRYVIIDQPENFSTDDVFTQEVLPDKVAMLAQSGMSDYKLYVVFKEIKFVLPSGDWEAFAASIAAKTKVAKESNAIIMVVPYFSMVCSGTNMLGMTVGKGTGIIMPAVYTTASFKAGMNSALSTVGNSWKATFNQAFKSIPKAHNVYAYSFLWNGDFIQHEVSKQKNVTGYENFNDIVLNDDGRYEELKKAETFLTSANIDSDVLQEQNATTDEYVNGALSAYFTMVETAMSSEQLVKVRIADDVRQSKITADNATTYARWVWTKKTDRATHFNLPNAVPADDFFYGGVNVVTAQEFMRVLDAASFASSFVGLDFIFDSWQAYYAYDKGFYLDAAIASSAVVITAVTAAELKVIVKGLRRAEFALVKTLYNKKLIVTALSKDRVYASFIPIVGKLNLQNILSSGVVSAIQNKQTFLSAIGYARKAEYQSLVQAFEKAVNESSAFKQLTNSNPSAVDVFFKYSKQKPAASVDEVLELATITKDLPKKQLDNFIADFGDAEFRAAVKGDAKLVDAWKEVAEHVNIRKHVPSLEKISEFLNDSDFLSKLPNGKADLDAIIDAVKNPLDAGTASMLVKLSDHLENVKQVVKKHSNADGFAKLMTDLKNPAFAMQDGVTHMMNDVKNFPEGSIRKFDYEFDGDGVVCTKCRFDVERTSGTPRLLEYKSWSLENIPNISVRQLTEYFRNASSIGDFKYVFNRLKTPDIDMVKSQMQTVLSQNADNLYKTLRKTFKEDLDIEEYSDFLELIRDTKSKLYNFIDIK